jgi:hypothetical protein
MSRQNLRGMARLAAFGVPLTLLLPDPAVAEPGTAAGQADPCRAAIAAAEAAERLPAGLLMAIGLVESGRRNPASGTVSPWPWTINAEGTGRFFATRAEAIAAVGELQARGVRLIDVGCMQVNLHHHPAAFSSTADAFDPLVNVRYAARFLSQLKAATGHWATAVGRYHSATPERAESYSARVAAVWPQRGGSIAVDRGRERLVESWAMASSRDSLAKRETALLARPNAPRDIIGRIAAAWSGMRPTGASGPWPAGAASSRLPPVRWRPTEEASTIPWAGRKHSG